MIEPHGAIGYLAAEEWRVDHPEDTVVVLETAHPSKFLDVMEEELGEGVVEIPGAPGLSCRAGEGGGGDGAGGEGVPGMAQGLRALRGRRSEGLKSNVDL